MEQLELLWHLQAIDLDIKTLKEKMTHHPQETKVEEARQELKIIVASREKLMERLKEIRRKQKRLELDLHQVSGNRKTFRNKLYGGEIGSVRELESLEKKLKLVEKEQGILEEEILVLMELSEELEAHLKEEEQRSRSCEQVLAEQKRVLEEIRTELQAEQELLQEKRVAIAARSENRYLELYRIQSGRHHGQGIARVINDNCDGCRVFISSAQRGLLYNPRAMVYCENCGRLLVRLPEPPEQSQIGIDTGKEVKGAKRKSPHKKSEQTAT